MSSSKFFRLSAKRFAVSCMCAFALLSCSVSAIAEDIVIHLDSDLDQIGDQIGTVQSFTYGGVSNMTFGIYDTGASVVSFSVDDQSNFEYLGTAIPIAVPGGAAAQGIGGDLIGDVSVAGTITADGMHAVDWSALLNILSGGDFVNWSKAVSVPNVQAFIGTNQSASLPAITGTPIHFPSSSGSAFASLISMQGYAMDFGAMFPELPEMSGISMNMPDVSFVAKGTTLTVSSTTTTYAPVRIPLKLMGDVNYQTGTGTAITSGPNPVFQNSVTLTQTATAAGGAASVSGKSFLFDTGAQMSIISPELADALHIDYQNSAISIDVQGAAGVAETVKGCVVDKILLPVDENGDGTPDVGKSLTLENVPVFVLDLGVGGLDGILGMNLFNTAESMLYDPTDPNNAYLSVAFLKDPDRGVSEELDPEALALLKLLAGSDATLGALFGLGGSVLRVPDLTSLQVPEPTTLTAFMAIGLIIVFRGGKRR